MHGLALATKSWLFAGSARGAARAAVTLTLIQAAKPTDADPQPWSADVPRLIANTPQTHLGGLLPQLALGCAPAKSRPTAAYAGWLQWIFVEWRKI